MEEITLDYMSYYFRYYKQYLILYVLQVGSVVALIRLASFLPLLHKDQENPSLQHILLI